MDVYGTVLQKNKSEMTVSAICWICGWPGPIPEELGEGLSNLQSMSVGQNKLTGAKEAEKDLKPDLHPECRTDFLPQQEPEEEEEVEEGEEEEEDEEQPLEEVEGELQTDLIV
ncbi:unnamed protein product [Ectocarpus sp. CCAP 1310/34]|nr:unnamed protein product [Ectocarpus sp. CCAP 1310/34]